MVCSPESKLFYGFTSAVILLEASVCITIAALLFVQIPETENIIKTEENISEFLNFFTTVNNETFHYSNENDTVIWYYVYIVVEGIWWLSALVLLRITCIENIYVRSYGFLLPAAIMTFLVCVRDVAGFCYFIILLFDYDDDGKETPLRERDAASFMNVFFVPLWFARGFIFWIVNVIFFIKLYLSYKYLKQTNTRSREMDDDNEFQMHPHRREKPSYLSVDDMSIQNGYIARKRQNNSFDNFGYEREPVPNYLREDRRQIGHKINGYNDALGPNANRNQNVTFLQPHKDRVEAINPMDHKSYNNIYKKSKDVSAGGNRYVPTPKYENQGAPHTPKPQYLYPPPRNSENQSNFSRNPMFMEDTVGVNKVNPLYQGYRQPENNLPSMPHINPNTIPAISYVIPRAHLNNNYVGKNL